MATKTEAKKMLTVIKKELRKLQKKWKAKKDWYAELEKGYDKDWWGVRVRTDAESYDYFYNDYAAQTRISKKINKLLKTDDDDHYFEKYGQGMIDIF